ncbi:MAG: hypothetical protein P1U67_01865 [Alcanivoracaceae bacterium]|nr:hypothetical protein [Alcanivoracaceae bacterium]
MFTQRRTHSQKSPPFCSITGTADPLVTEEFLYTSSAVLRAALKARQLHRYALM